MMSCQGRILSVFLIVCIAINRYYYLYSRSGIQSIQLRRSNDDILLVMSITTQEDVIHYQSLNSRFHHLN